MYEESGNSFYYQSKAEPQPCRWVTVDLRRSDMAMWQWQWGLWWHFKAVLYCSSVFVPCFFRRWKARARAQKGMLLWPWKQFFKRQLHRRISANHSGRCNMPERGPCLIFFYCSWSALHFYWLLVQGISIELVKELRKLTVSSVMLLKIAIWLWARFLS